MTQKQKELKAKLIKQIHISKKYQEFYRYNRDVYEDIVKKHFEVASSKDMSIEQLLHFCDWLNDKTKELATIKPTTATKKQLEAIKSLWGEVARDKSDDALRAFISRITKNNYLRVESISKKDAQKMIPVLKKMRR